VSSGAPHPPRDDADAMRWVANVLLGELADDPEIVVGPKAPSGHRVLWTFSMLPGGDDPYVLIPADAPRAAAAAVHGLGNPLRSRDRAVEAAAGLAMRTRVGPRFAPSLVVSAPGPVARHRTLPGHLATVLGRDDAVCAVILGRRRPNRKPVLKMLTPGGEVLAYAKVGWNDLTANLVRAEAEAMARIAAAGPRTFRVPRVLASGPWAGLELLVTAPAPATTRGDGPPLRMPGDATREVAAIHGVEQGTFADSAYRAGLVSRVEAGEADDTTALLHHALASLDEAWGQEAIPFGSWHGDWMPWNLLRSGTDLWVWDWERWASGVPVGLDAAHFRFDIESKIRGRSPEESAASSAGWTEVVGPDLGARPGSGRPLAVANLLEMCLRFREGRQAGMEAKDVAYVRALRSLISDHDGGAGA
jgi:hypothetical protein